MAEDDISDEEFSVLVGQLLDLIEDYGLEVVRDAFDEAEEQTQEGLPELQDDIETDDEPAPFQH